MGIPTSALEVFIRSVEIASYIPGRVRLRTKKIVKNEKLAAEVKARLLAFGELDSVETSTATGSILITYRPERLRTNPELVRVEEYIRTHVKG